MDHRWTKLRTAVYSHEGFTPTVEVVSCKSHRLSTLENLKAWILPSNPLTLATLELPHLMLQTLQILIHQEEIVPQTSNWRVIPIRIAQGMQHTADIAMFDCKKRISFVAVSLSWYCLCIFHWDSMNCSASPLSTKIWQRASWATYFPGARWQQHLAQRSRLKIIAWFLAAFCFQLSSQKERVPACKPIQQAARGML